MNNYNSLLLKIFLINMFHSWWFLNSVSSSSTTILIISQDLFIRTDHFCYKLFFANLFNKTYGVFICVRSTAIDNSQSTTNANSNQTKNTNQLTIYQKTVLICVLYQDIPQPLRTSQSTRSRICQKSM